MPKATKTVERLFRIFPYAGPDMAFHRMLTDGGLFMAVNLPWDMVAPHEEQARKNHRGQSLQQLTGRGGLHAAAVVAILEDRDETEMSVVEANMRLVELWIEFEKTRIGLATT
ncbi:hypothetical protein HFO56_23080 [Rhizobium laguerreae]|uniref:hypothetical protein n=1 Tax=Rhizobium laguerreae TaxID=1076926 RepID=UPI001C914586|nr:hypothetical protein [Rhizobium laguerreae]MBY3155209.1 hypothetical protein [Rhizobium laguerreae]